MLFLSTKYLNHEADMFPRVSDRAQCESSALLARKKALLAPNKPY